MGRLHKEEINEYVRKKMKFLREKENKKQETVASWLNTSPQNMSLIEAGKRKLKISDIDELCKHFQVTPNYFFGYEDRESKKVQNLIDNSKRQLLDKIKDYIQTLYDNDHLNTRDIKTVNRNEQKKP